MIIQQLSLDISFRHSLQTLLGSIGAARSAVDGIRETVERTNSDESVEWLRVMPLLMAFDCTPTVY